LFNQIQGGRIESRSIAPSSRNPSNDFDVNGLRVVDVEACNYKSLGLQTRQISAQVMGLVNFW
jgi:hypothetical protein